MVTKELKDTRNWLTNLKRDKDWPRDLSVGWKLLTRELEKSRQVECDDDFEPDMD